MRAYFCYFIFLACICCLCSCKNKRAENPNHTHWADSIANHGLDLMAGHDPTSSLVYLDSVRRASPWMGRADIWRLFNARVNYYASYKIDTAKRKAYIDSLFTLIKGREDYYNYEYAHALFEKAKLMLNQRKYTLAFRFCFEGRNFAKNTLDNCSLSDFSGFLGSVRFNQGEFLAAVPYLKQAFSEVSECNSNASFNYVFIAPQSILNTTALCFEHAGLADSAVLYYRRDLDYVNKNKNKFPEKQVFVQTSIGVIEGNLGGAYAKLDQYPQAVKHLKQSIAINDRPGYDIEDAQTAKIKLAGLFLNHNNFNGTDVLLGQLGRDLATGRGKSVVNDYVRRKWYELKWRFYDRTGQLDSAYSYLKKYHHFADSVDLLNSGLQRADMDQASASVQQQYQLTLLNKNNEVKSAYLAAFAIFLVMAILIAGTIWYYLKRSARDVVKLRGLNTRLGNTLAALEQSQAENIRMMNIVVHDLRNPIGAIISLAGMMLETARPEEDQAMLEMIRTSGRNSLDLVSELLQVNMKQTLLKEPADLKALLLYCIGLLQHKALDKNQQLVLDSETVFIDLSREQMWRLISNLIGNAIKFSGHGAVIRVALQQQPGEVIISIKDQGIGIPEELRGKLFDMFTESKRSGTAGETSYGLGLAISKQIVEAHGGKIWFESIAGKGTTFFISLPLY
jgi:signal transduction histidine kinase